MWCNKTKRPTRVKAWCLQCAHSLSRSCSIVVRSLKNHTVRIARTRSQDKKIDSCHAMGYVWTSRAPSIEPIAYSHQLPGVGNPTRCFFFLFFGLCQLCAAIFFSTLLYSTLRLADTHGYPGGSDGITPTLFFLSVFLLFLTNKSLSAAGGFIFIGKVCSEQWVVAKKQSNTLSS